MFSFVLKKAGVGTCDARTKAFLQREGNDIGSFELKEIESLRTAVLQLTTQNPDIFFLTGKLKVRLAQTTVIIEHDIEHRVIVNHSGHLLSFKTVEVT